MTDPHPQRRVLVTGAAGNLGRHLVGAAPQSADVVRTWRQTPLRPQAGATDHRVDLGHAEAVADLFDRTRPDLVIHAAYDKQDLDRGIVAATRNVATAAAETGAELVHISSDVVFDGEHAPYDEHHSLCPISAYGVAKATAETDVRRIVPDATVVRTSLQCALDPIDPVTAWVVHALETGEPITLFTDEVRMPARADHLAARIWALCDLPRHDRSGPWHLVGPEALNRVEIGQAVADGLRLDRAPLRSGTSTPLNGDARPRDLRLTVTRADTPTTPNGPIAELFDHSALGGDR